MQKQAFISRKAAYPYFLITPAILFIVIFLAYPITRVFYLSFQHYNPSRPFMNGFAGFDNYLTLFRQKEFYEAVWVSIKWVVSEVFLQLLLGLFVALALNCEFKGRSILRTLVFMPWALSGVLTATLWALLYNEHIGLINTVLRQFGLISRNIAWTGNLNKVFGAVVVAELWRGIPFFAISLLATLQNIPGELYEASDIDGCGTVKKFQYITLPLLKEQIILSSLLRFVWEFNSVDLIFSLTGGGPAGKTTTLSILIANQAIQTNNFGYGSAISVISFMFLTFFAVFYIKLTRFGKGI